MPRRPRNWSKPHRLLHLSREGQLIISPIGEPGGERPALGLPSKRWSEADAEQYAEMTGFTPVELTTTKEAHA